MKLGFYPRLAMDGIRKNRRMYLPYLLTCIGVVMIHYILVYLQDVETIREMRGGEMVREMLSLGNGILLFFSVIFLFYTNSFLIRRRKREFGLYHVLGMGKKNLVRIVLWENLFVAVGSITLGLVGGILFSKLAELGALNLVGGEISYRLSLSLEGIWRTWIYYGLIFGLLFGNTVRQIYVSSTLQLLRSENVGEKPPRANWVLGLLGLLALGAAYYLALTIENPLHALTWFFVAAILVIVATYLLLMAGSVLLCRLLQKNKRYYYQSKHFVSVSSMAYRMKRNGAGLASICILATMVLVMISSTAALYMGEEDILHSRYLGQLNVSLQLGDEAFSEENVDELRRDVVEIAEGFGAEPKIVDDYRSVYVAGLLMGEEVECDKSRLENGSPYDFSNLYEFQIISLADYNRKTGEHATLEEDEALLYCFRSDYQGDQISFRRGKRFRIKEKLTEATVSGDMAVSIVPTIVLVVADPVAAVEGLTFADGSPMYVNKWEYYFDVNLKEEEELRLAEELTRHYQEEQDQGTGRFETYRVDSREENRRDFLGTFGGLFYLGILLSIVFLLAAVLIIYYKQISEGYEDQARFEIMQKVGMTKGEIRKSINSQMLTVFFVPLAFAGLHLAFAFPIIQKLLIMFNMRNTPLYVGTTVGSLLVFALFYALVYKATSNAYYGIVSGARE